VIGSNYQITSDFGSENFAGFKDNIISIGKLAFYPQQQE